MEKNSRLFIAAAEVLAINLGIYVAIHQQQIRPAVVVDVEEHCSPSQILRVQPQSSCGSGVGKGPIPVVFIESGGIVGKIRLENIQMPVAVIVRDGRSHPGLLAAILVECGSGGYRHIVERSVMVVAVEDRGRAVAGNEDVRPSIFIEVEGRNAERVVTIGAKDASFRLDILKCSVATIVVKSVF